jgi:hypothetical protein
MVATTCEVTVDVVIVKLVVELPAGTTIGLGTVALVELEVTVTDDPPGPAAPVSVKVPIEVAPPLTVDGDSVKRESVAGVMVSVAVCDIPAVDPVIVTAVELETAEVAMLNVAVEAPGFTVTEVGTVALPLLELSDTTVPFAAALPFKVTVPVAMFPP